MASVVGSSLESMVDSAAASIGSGEPCRNLILDFVDIPEPFQIFLRIRPLTAKECSNGAQLMTYVADENKLTVVPLKGGVGQGFTFSKILDADMDQAEVFDATSLSAVQDFISGQNCIIFSYGVTNSGKTFTMQGTPCDPGIIPRALDVIFQSVSSKMSANPPLLKPQNGGIAKINSKDLAVEDRVKQQVLKDPHSTCSLLMESLSTSHWKNSTISSSTLSDLSRQSLASVHSMMELMDEEVGYSIFVSFIEIYNEKVYDLLVPVMSSGHQLIRPDLKLQENRDGYLFVKGVREIRVDSVDEALRLLLVGQQNLQVASTRLNYSSSRSHSMYIVKLMRVINDSLNAAHVSQLCFCDLAGSERHSKTESVGHRLKEAGIINSSLLVLGRCITALRHNQLHPNEAPLPIPFRDSKLTRVFQGYFTGLGKALMIVSASPDANTVNETMHVLRFSAIAKEVVLPQNLEFLSNPVKVSNLSLDLIRQSLDCVHSISWGSPRPSSMGAASRLGSSAQQASDVLLEEDENESSTNDDYYDDDDNNHEGSECEEDNNAKLQKYFEVIQILREMLLREHKEKMEMELSIREELTAGFVKILDDEQRRTSERIQREREDAEKMYGSHIQNQAEYYQKQLSYKQREIDSACSGEELKALTLNTESLATALREVSKEKDIYERKLIEQEERQQKVVLENASKIASLEAQIETLQSHISALWQPSIRCDTMYETAIVTSSTSSESEGALRGADRKLSRLYVTVVDPPTTDLDSSVVSNDEDTVFHDVYSAKRSTGRPSLFAAETSYESNVECILESFSDERDDVMISETVEAFGADEMARRPLELLSKEEQTELSVADIEALEARKIALEERIVDLEADVAKLDGTRQCLELDKAESRVQIAELMKQVKDLQSEAAVLNERLMLDAIREQNFVDSKETIVAELYAKLEIAENDKRRYALELEESRSTVKNLADEVELLRADSKHLKKQHQDAVKNAEMSKKLEAELERLRNILMAERSEHSALLEKHENLSLNLKAEVMKSKLLETELEKSKTRSNKKPPSRYQGTDTDDSDFENKPMSTRRKTTRERNRTKKTITVARNQEPEVMDSSDSSILSNVPLSSNRMHKTPHPPKSSSKMRVKSVASTSRKEKETKDSEQKPKRKQHLAKAKELAEFSPISSPEENPSTKMLVQRVLRSRK